MRFVVNKILRIFGWIVLSLLSFIAILLLVLHLFSPNLQGYKPDVEHYVSTMMAQPVKIGAIDVGVHNFEPVLSLHDSVILARDGKTSLIKVSELQVGFDLFGSLVQWHLVPGLLVVKGTSISLQQQVDGDVKVLDLHAAMSSETTGYAEKTPFLQWLLTQGKIELSDLNITWMPYQGAPLILSNLDLLLTNRFSLHELQLSGLIKQTNLPGNFSADLKIHGDILEHQDLSVSGDFVGQNLKLQLATGTSKNNIFSLIHDGDLELQGQNLQLSFGSMFRKPIFVNKISSSLFWQQNKDAIEISAAQCKAQNSQMQLNGNLKLTLPQVVPADPQIDLHAKFSITDIPNVKDYLPVTVIPKNAVAWLDNAFISGSKVTGTLLLQGHLNQYPFANGGGHFLIDSYIHNIDLHYQKDWPRIDNLYGNLIFENQGMRVRIDSANILGIPTLPLIATISELGDPVLEVDGGLNTDSSNGLNFVAASPLRETVGQELQGMTLHGPMQFKLHLHIPLGEEVSKHDVMHVAGKINLQNNTLGLSDWKLAFAKFNGELQFTEDSLTANNLAAVFLKQPVTLNISTLNTNKNDFITEIQITGKTAIADVQNAFAVKLNPYLTGNFNYAAVLDLHHNHQIENTLKVTSDLQGVNVDLPVPFNKAPTTPTTFTYTYYFGVGNVVREFITYADKLSAALSFKKMPHNGLKFIAGELKLNAINAAWQTQPGLVITGNMEKIDWAYWQDYLFNKVKVAATPGIIRNIKIFIKQLRVFGQDLQQIELQLTPQNSGQEWLVGLNNSNIQGNFVIPRTFGNKQIHGEFARLYLNESNKKQITAIQPQTVPPLNFVINDFRYGDKNLGKVAFDTVPLLTAMQINNLSISTSDFSVTATGKWTSSKGKQATSLSGKFASQNIGAMLKNMQLAESLVGGVTNINFALNWDGAPFEPALRKLNGALSILVQRGRITNLGQKTETELGFGRVLSLLSLQTLPRRLTLDFSDLTKSGFSFDTLKGNAELRNGDVFTNNVKLDGPVAQVLVKGRIGLVAKDYDILLSTIPHVTSSIPIIATIAGGPIVGAATWLAEKVVGSQVGKVSTYTYRVTGPWEQPNVVKSN